MGTMKQWMLGAAMVAGVAAMGTTAAQAAEFGFHVRGPVAYIPPCPGPGYIWTDGYMNNGYWIPGFWSAGARFGGPVVRYDRGFYNRGYDRGFDRGGDRHFAYNRGGQERFRR